MFRNEKFHAKAGCHSLRKAPGKSNKFVTFAVNYQILASV